MSDTNQPTATADPAGISLLAYQMWKDAGCPEGQDQKFWFEAEARMRTAAKATPPAPVASSPPAETKSAAPQKTPSAPFNPAFGQIGSPSKSNRQSRRA